MAETGVVHPVEPVTIHVSFRSQLKTIDVAVAHLKRAKIWRPADATSLIEQLHVIESGHIALCRGTVIEETAKETLIQRVVKFLGEFAPHLVRESKLLARNGRTTTGVEGAQLAECVDVLITLLSASTCVNESAYQDTLEMAFKPMIEFLHTLLNSSDALSWHSELRYAAAKLLRDLVHIKQLKRLPSEILLLACEVLVGFLEAFEFNPLHWHQRVCNPAMYLISYLSVSTKKDTSIPVELDNLVVALLRSAMRVNFCPSSDDGFDLGKRFVRVLSNWRDARTRVEVKVRPFNVNHYAAFPLILDLCTNPNLFDTDMIACVATLALWFHSIGSAPRNVVSLSADEAVTALRFAATVVERNATSERNFSPGNIFATLTHLDTPKNEEFESIYHSSTILNYIEASLSAPQKHGKQRLVWPLMAVCTYQDILRGYIERGGAAAAQLLLDYAVNVPSYQVYNNLHQDGVSHDIQLIRIVLHATEGIEGLSYDLFRQHTSEIARSVRFLFRDTESVPAWLAFATALLLHGEPDEAATNYACQLVMHIMKSDNRYAPWKVDDTAHLFIPWDDLGWRYRIKTVDVLLILIFSGRASADCRKKALLWMRIINHHTPTGTLTDWNLWELRSGLAYASVLILSDRAPPDVREYDITLESILRFVSDHLNSRLSNTRSLENCLMAIWAYCAIWLPGTTIIDPFICECLWFWRGLCTSFRIEAERDRVPRMEATGEILRVTTPFAYVDSMFTTDRQRE